MGVFSTEYGDLWGTYDETSREYLRFLIADPLVKHIDYLKVLYEEDYKFVEWMLERNPCDLDTMANIHNCENLPQYCVAQMRIYRAERDTSLAAEFSSMVAASKSLGQRINAAVRNIERRPVFS